MKRKYQILGVIGLLFAAFVASQALSLRLMTRLGPGPGFFPFILAMLFAFLSSLLLIRPEQFAGVGCAIDDAPPDFTRKITALLLLGAIIATAFLFERFGYCLTMLAFCTFALVTLGERRWYVIIPAVLLGSFGVYFVFVRYLGVSLPSGMLAI